MMTQRRIIAIHSVASRIGGVSPDGEYLLAEKAPNGECSWKYRYDGWGFEGLEKAIFMYSL